MPWIDDLPAELADSLSSEIKENPTLIQYNTFEDLLNGHINTKSLVGSSIRVPGEDAGDEDRTEFYNKLINKAPNLMIKPDFSEPEQAQEFYNLFGKPGDATQYKMPEGHTLQPDVESELREMGFSANMNQEQFQKMVTEMDSRNTQLQENVKGQTEKSMADLKGKWGMTFEERMAAAKKVNERFYPGRDSTHLNASDLESLYNINESLTGKGPQVATQIGTEGGITPQEAREQGAEIMRRVHDPKSTLEPHEKLALIHKRINLLKKYVPEFAE